LMDICIIRSGQPGEPIRPVPDTTLSELKRIYTAKKEKDAETLKTFKGDINKLSL